MRLAVKFRIKASGCFSNASRRSAGLASGVPSYSWPLVSSGIPFSLMRHLPETSKLSSANPIGSMN